MKKIFNWRIFLGVFLIGLSALIYYLHFTLFHDAHHIFIYLVGDIAFVPVEVLLVTLIIHHLLESRSKRLLMKKMNMLIGAFFSDTGTKLLSIFSSFDPTENELSDKLNIERSWKEKKYRQTLQYLGSYPYNIEIKGGEINQLAEFLTGKMKFLLSLLANPNLLEHETFTDVLWAVFHLAEELSSRDDLENLPNSDFEHLTGDIKRAYKAVSKQWLLYMKHLRDDYPYLYSLAMRKNPFISNSSVIVYT